MILLHSFLNFGYPTENPVTTVWGAGDISRQDDTPIPTLCVLTVYIYCLSFLIDNFKMIFFCLGLVRSYTTCHFDGFYNKKLFQRKHWQPLFCSAIMYDKCTHKKHKHTFFSLICYVSVCGYYYIIIIFHNKEVTVPIHCWTINNIHITYYHIVNSTLTTITRVS